MSTGSTRSVSMIGGCSVTVQFPYLSVQFSLYGASLRRGLTLDVEEANVAGVALDEAAATLDVLAHQDREDLVGGSSVVEGDLEQDAVVGIHRGLPQLLVVHLAQT